MHRIHLTLPVVAAMFAALVAPTAPSFASTTVPMCGARPATIVGTDGPDELVGTSGIDVIAGLGGDDVVHGEGGSDVICGGEGDDRLVTADDVARPRLMGGPGRDRLVTSAFDTYAVGGGGDDTIVLTQPGGLHLTSEPGDDTIVTRSRSRLSFDFKDSRAGVRLDVPRGTLIDRGHKRLRLGGATFVRVAGSRYRDVVRSGDAGSTLRGAGGNDHLVGGDGEDTIYGGPGRNVMKGRGDADFFGFYRNHDGRDLVYGGEGGDWINLDTLDRAHGGPGRDMLAGYVLPGSHQVLDGGAGTNGLIVFLRRPASGRPWHHATVDLRHRRVAADNRSIAVFGRFTHAEADGAGASRWTMLGTRAGDYLGFGDKTAHPRPVLVRGRGGNDEIVTGGGNDRLYGGPGHDRGYADGGNDICSSIEAVPQPFNTSECETTIQ